MFSVCGSIHDFALLIAKRIVSPVFFEKVEGFCYHRLSANVRRGREVRKVKKGEERGRSFARAISSRGSFRRGSATF